MTTVALDPVVKQIDDTLDAALDRLCDLLRIPSVSTDPAFKDDTARAAQWCSDQLSEIGFDASVRETTGHPMVVGHYTPDHATEDTPHIMYYGHYDVQPPDPLELWDTAPFEPTLVDAEHGKRIVARGAVDDKGQMMTFIEAFRAWKAVHGSLPIRITVFLEGEEESGSPSMKPFFTRNREELTADVCVVSDTGMWDINTPAVTYMLRGMVYMEVTLKGPSHDLHSGMYGGAVTNPNNALARVLAQLHDDDGVVQIPGFYDDVVDLTPDEAAQWEQLGFNETAFIAEAGCEVPVGEKGQTTLQRIWSRPTCDINGMWGGYIGAGAKTVIPAQAHAKISCRLVANQDPGKVYEGIVQFFEQRTPPNCTWEFQPHGMAPAIRVPTDSPYLEAALRALRNAYGTDAFLIGCGGSIPVVGEIQELLGFDSLLVGFGLDDDRVHSPNEKFELRCFEMGIKSHAAMLAEFANL
jgi:acetylornithine deacetylase/succinyl-diaminopimelate desuccinylase-like protein